MARGRRHQVRGVSQEDGREDGDGRGRVRGGREGGREEPTTTS